MTVSRHALERLSERFPETYNWSEDRKILRLIETFHSSEYQGEKENAGHHLGKIRLSIVKNAYITLVEKDGIVLTVY